MTRYSQSKMEKKESRRFRENEKKLQEFLSKENKKVFRCPLCEKESLKIELDFAYGDYGRIPGSYEAKAECNCGIKEHVQGRFLGSGFLARKAVEEKLWDLVEDVLQTKNVNVEVK